MGGSCKNRPRERESTPYPCRKHPSNPDRLPHNTHTHTHTSTSLRPGLPWRIRKQVDWYEVWRSLSFSPSAWTLCGNLGCCEAVVKNKVQVSRKDKSHRENMQTSRHRCMDIMPLKLPSNQAIVVLHTVPYTVLRTLPIPHQSLRSRNLYRRRSRQSHGSQAIDIWRLVLRRQRRKRHPRQPVRNRRLDLAVACGLGGGVFDDVGLVDPADEEWTVASRGPDLGGVEAERDGLPSARRLLLDVGRHGGDGRELGRGFAGARNDEFAGEVEGVGGGDAGVEGGRVGDELQGLLAEEGVVARFDGDDGGGDLDQAWVGGGEARNDVDNAADAGRSDDVGEGEEFLGAVDGELVLARFEGGLVEMLEDVYSGLDVDEFLLKEEIEVGYTVQR